MASNSESELSIEEQVKNLNRFLKDSSIFTVVQLKQLGKQLKVTEIRCRDRKADIIQKLLPFVKQRLDTLSSTSASSQVYAVQEPEVIQPEPPTYDFFNPVPVSSYEEAWNRVYGDDSEYDIVLLCDFEDLDIDTKHFNRRAKDFSGEMAETHVEWQSVREFRRSDGTKATKITGECAPEMSTTKSNYIVRLMLDDKRKVVAAFCNCLNGIIGSCKHSRVLALFINEEQTKLCTSLPVKWVGPARPKKVPKGQVVVGGIVKAKEFKCQVLPVNAREILEENSDDLDSPLMDLYRTERRLKEEAKKANSSMDQ